MTLDHVAESIGISTLNDDSEAINGNDEDFSSTQQNLLRLLKTFKSHFQQNIGQLPIVCFNSWLYDLNLMKHYLLKSLQLFRTLTSIKCSYRDSRFFTIWTPNLQFVDNSHLRAAGTSPDNILKARGSKTNTVYFP